MWIAKKDIWNEKILPAEKFLAERIIQRCDYEETISKKHRTVNGYILVKELINCCELSFKRNRVVISLKVLIEEARDKRIPQNIVNDVIINSYFQDLKDFINSITLNELKVKNRNEPNLIYIKKILHELKKYDIQLEEGYHTYLKREFENIDYNEKDKVDRIYKKISDLIDIYIPFLLNKGYSVSSINEVTRKWVRNNYRITANRLFSFFNYTPKKFDFIIRVKNDSNEFEEFKEIISSQHESTKEVKVSDLDSSNILSYFDSDDIVIMYSHNCIDPNYHIREQYDNVMKQLVINGERESLAVFNDYFKNCLWSSGKKRFSQASIVGDPISIHERKSTLKKTLVYYSKCSQTFDYRKNEKIPKVNNEQVRKSLYYYNLALKSKSIENSFSLLWVSLETLLPYRTHNSDIECLKHLLGKSLSIGSLTRDLSAFIKRVKQTQIQNGGDLNEFMPLNINPYKKQNYLKWFEWLNEGPEKDNRFNRIKNYSELLAFEYYRIGSVLQKETLSTLNKRIVASKTSLEYQLQRIYLHRNQIVHSGYMINEYTNLWLHLEWYVGKILAFSVYSLTTTEDESFSTIFRKIEAHVDYLLSYFEKNKNKKIKDLDEKLNTLLDYSWQQ